MSNDQRFCGGAYVPRSAELRPECKTCELSQIKHRAAPVPIAAALTNGECVNRVELTDPDSSIKGINMITTTPAPSRRKMSPLMASRGLRSVSELALSKPHGTTIRYYAGCRCDECRFAVKLYSIERANAKDRGESNHLMDAAPVVAHLRMLSAERVGKRQIHAHASVSTATLDRLIRGDQTKIRAQTAKRIMALKPDDVRADGATIPAGGTWALIDELIASGYSRASIASELLGHKARGLQISRCRVEVKTADRVREIHAAWSLASHDQSAKALAVLAEIRAEGFRHQRILREACELAEKLGLPTPTLEPVGKTFRMRHFEVSLIDGVYATLTEVAA